MKNRLNIDKTAMFRAQQPYMDYFMAKNAAKAQNYGVWEQNCTCHCRTSDGFYCECLRILIFTNILQTLMYCAHRVNSLTKRQFWESCPRSWKRCGKLDIMQKMSLSWYLYYIFLCVKSGSGDSYQHFLKGCRMQAEFGERKGFQGSE